MSNFESKIEFGQIDERWQEHGILQKQIMYNGKRSGLKTIEKDGKLIGIVSNRYALLPNEEALKITNNAATAVGLEPFTVTSASHLRRMEKFNHVIVDQKNARMTAFYSHKVADIAGDKVYVGIGVTNSIDGSTAFSAGGFSFRVSCANAVVSTIRKLSVSLPQSATIDFIHKRHTGKNFEQFYMARIEASLQAVMTKTLDFVKAYEKMSIERVNRELLEKLNRANLSKKLLPEYIKKVPADIGHIKYMTQWELYNTLTKEIWHNQKTDIPSKTTQFNKLHRAMPIAQV